MNFDQLNWFVENVCGGRDMLLGLSSSEVKRRYITPTVEVHGFSFSHFVQQQGIGQTIQQAVPIITPSLLVVHSLEDPFLDLIDALDVYLKELDVAHENPGLWIDMFCLNPRISKESFVSEVQQACERIGNIIVVLSPWDSLHVFRSPLCQYQMHFAASKGYLFDIATTKPELARLAKVAFASKITVERIFNDHIRLLDDATIIAEEVPVGTYELLLEPFLQNHETRKGFVELIQSRLSEWLSMFLRSSSNQALAFGNMHIPQPEWSSQVLDAFDNTVTSMPQRPSLDSTREVTMRAALLEREAFYLQYLHGPQAETLGRSHHSVMLVIEDLIEVYRQLTDFDKAEPWIVELLQLQLQVHGEKSMEAMRTLLKLANLYRSRQEFARAALKYQELLARMVQVFNTVDHANVIAVKQKLAKVFVNSNEYERALRIHFEIYRVVFLTKGLQDSTTLTTVSTIGQLLLLLRQFDMAVQFSLRALEEAVDLFGDRDGVVNLYQANLNQLIQQIHRVGGDEYITTPIPMQYVSAENAVVLQSAEAKIIPISEDNAYHSAQLQPTAPIARNIHQPHSVEVFASHEQPPPLATPAPLTPAAVETNDVVDIDTIPTQLCAIC